MGGIPLAIGGGVAGHTLHSWNTSSSAPHLSETQQKKLNSYHLPKALHLSFGMVLALGESSSQPHASPPSEAQSANACKRASQPTQGIEVGGAAVGDAPVGSAWRLRSPPKLPKRRSRRLSLSSAYEMEEKKSNNVAETARDQLVADGFIFFAASFVQLIDQTFISDNRYFAL